MDSDLGSALARLSAAVPEDRLAGMEDRVMAGIAARREGNASRGVAAATFALALALGIGSTLTPAPPARAAAPLGIPGALAPSSLLGGSL